MKLDTVLEQLGTVADSTLQVIPSITYPNGVITAGGTSAIPWSPTPPYYPGGTGGGYYIADNNPFPPLQNLQEETARLMLWAGAWCRLMELFPHIELLIPNNHEHHVVTFEVIFPISPGIPGFLVWNLCGVSPGFWTSTVVPRLEDMKEFDWRQTGPEDYAVRTPAKISESTKFMKWLIGKESRK